MVTCLLVARYMSKLGLNCLDSICLGKYFPGTDWALDLSRLAVPTFARAAHSMSWTYGKRKYFHLYVLRIFSNRFQYHIQTAEDICFIKNRKCFSQTSKSLRLHGGRTLSFYLETRIGLTELKH